MEIWDGYFKDGTPANQDLVRGEPIPNGLYHLVSEILIRHTDGDYLLMKRDTRKPNYGGYYEATAGGSALKGEDKLTCAKREVFEETGITAENITEIGRYVSHDTIYYNYLCVTDCDKLSIILQEGETIGYKWITEKEFAEFVNSNEMIPSQKDHYRQYFVAIGIAL